MELVTRAIAAWNALPSIGRVVVITHGGPIAAIRAKLANSAIEEIAQYRVPECSVSRVIERSMRLRDQL